MQNPDAPFVNRRAKTSAVPIVACLLSLAAITVQTQEQFQLYANIADASGTPVTTVRPTDIRVLESGSEASVLRIESSSTPVKLQLLLDNGVGLGGENIIHLRNGVRALLENLPSGIESTIVATAGQPRVLVRPTTDRRLLNDGVGLIAPDPGAGKFIEALSDATVRIERDKDAHVAAIVAFATTAGDLIVMERDVEAIARRLQSHQTIVHVVLLSLMGSRSVIGGRNQLEVGIGTAAMTGGRFETIAAASRLATLLPEIGAEVGQMHLRKAHQFKITVQRPKGATGEVKNVTMSAFGGLSVTSVSKE